MMSIALKDSYDAKQETGKNIFPSITCGQACFEGGICGAPISVIGKNHFAVRAYSYFTGMVYDDHELVLYGSYADAENIKGSAYMEDNGFWRAYSTWEECVHDHTQMLLTQEKYSAVISAHDYAEAAQAYQDSKYMGEKANYKKNLLKRVEGYDFVQLDSVKADSRGVFGLIMSESNVHIESGESYALTATAYPVGIQSSEIIWSSLDPEVASVDDGVVTALSAGYALITARYNGKEACCVVCVDCNGYNMYGTTALRESPSASSAKLGKLAKGQPVTIDGETIKGSDGEDWYAVTARVSTGALVRGYVPANRIYEIAEPRKSVRTESEAIKLSVGDQKDIAVTVHSDEFANEVYEWRTSNADIADISAEGTVRGVREGTAVLSLYAGERLVLTVPVTVGSPDLKAGYANRSFDLRAKPVRDKTRNEYGTVKKGSALWVIDEENKDWYRVLAYADGRYYDGYARRAYISFNADRISLPDALLDLQGEEYDRVTEKREAFLLSNPSLIVCQYDIDDTFISGIEPGTTADTFTAAVPHDTTVSRNGIILSGSAAICTGDIVSFCSAGEAMQSYVAVVTGDVNSDGCVDEADCDAIKHHLFGSEVLTGARFQAGCISGGDTITTTDYFLCKRMIIENSDLEA